MNRSTPIRIVLTGDQVYQLLRVLDHDERMHPAEARRLAKTIRKAVKEQE
jgi:hypothetical protein